MNIISYSGEEIQEGLSRARDRHQNVNDHIRLIFSPVRINHDNFERACDVYSRLDASNYNTVVVVETFDRVLEKKLPMPSNRYFETPLGRVTVNDHLRNEFCDEEDDFFIHDEGYSKDMSLYQQLMLLQSSCGDFNVLSVQIADERPTIIKELVHVLDVVLAPKNALVVFCCELDNARKKEFARVRKLIRDDNRSGLLNYLNSGESRIEGTSSFVAGILLARAWELNLTFLNGEYEDYRGSLLTAYADRQKVLF